jgi:hypothetical protein
MPEQGSPELGQQRSTCDLLKYAARLMDVQLDLRYDSFGRSVSGNVGGSRHTARAIPKCRVGFQGSPRENRPPVPVVAAGAQAA